MSVYSGRECVLCCWIDYSLFKYELTKLIGDLTQGLSIPTCSVSSSINHQQRGTEFLCYNCNSSSHWCCTSLHKIYDSHTILFNYLLTLWNDLFSCVLFLDRKHTCLIINSKSTPSFWQWFTQICLDDHGTFPTLLFWTYLLWLGHGRSVPTEGLCSGIFLLAVRVKTGVGRLMRCQRAGDDWVISGVALEGIHVLLVGSQSVPMRPSHYDNRLGPDT